MNAALIGHLGSGRSSPHVLLEMGPLMEAPEWRSGGVAEWRSGGVAEWRSGGVAEWRSGGVAEWAG